MAHMIQLAEDVHPYGEGHLFAESYVLEDGWLTFVDGETGETRVYPSHAVEEVIVDDGLLE